MAKLFDALIGLSAFGPIALIPLSLNRLNISSCALFPPSPVSEKPPGARTTPFTLLATQSLTISGALLAGTATTASQYPLQCSSNQGMLLTP